MIKRYSYFKSELIDSFVIIDEIHKETLSGIDDEYTCIRIVRKLNTLIDENEQLKGEVAHYKLILMSLEQEAKRISTIR